mmetsp:Transcript_21497/g.52653  ORF Transcript_21497/g.52653 Transcript_21497/m.52653 type:complete len:271 (-) Transcript_21497:139-951(-)
MARAAKEIEIAADIVERHTRPGVGDGALDLRTRPHQRLCVEHVKVVEPLVAIPPPEDEEPMSGRGRRVVGAGGRDLAKRLDGMPLHRLNVECVQVVQVRPTIAASEDEYLLSVVNLDEVGRVHVAGAGGIPIHNGIDPALLSQVEYVKVVGGERSAAQPAAQDVQTPTHQSCSVAIPAIRHLTEYDGLGPLVRVEVECPEVAVVALAVITPEDVQTLAVESCRVVLDRGHLFRHLGGRPLHLGKRRRAAVTTRHNLSCGSRLRGRCVLEV